MDLLCFQRRSWTNIHKTQHHLEQNQGISGVLAVTCMCFSPDSEAMGYLLQITMSCPCALSRQVAGAGCRCWCCELVCTWWNQIAGAGAGAGAVSWLRTWWRQVAGAGAGCWVLGAGALRRWCCARGGDRLLVLLVVLGCRVPVLVVLVL